MKSTVERLSPTRVRINVEVPFDELKPDFDRAYRKIAQQVRIPGFRPGKAPARILEARLGRDVVLDEVVNNAIPVKYSEAVSTADDVSPIGRPEIEVTEIADGDHLAFTAEVDVRPEITLPDFDDIAVTVDDIEVTDEQVTEQLDNLRARFGTLTGVERPAGEDDFVLLDLSAAVNGEPVEEATTSGFSYQVGQGGLIDGLDEAVRGLSAGESKHLHVPARRRRPFRTGRGVTVTVTAVKERELPGSRRRVRPAGQRVRLAGRAHRRPAGAARARTPHGAGRPRLATVCSRRSSTAPRCRCRRPSSPRRSTVGSTTPSTPSTTTTSGFAEFLREQGSTREEFDADARAEAERNVKTRLVLDALAEPEEVSVSDEELTERIVFQAQQYQMPPEEFVRRVQEAGQLGAIFSDVRRSKALISAVGAATVTDASGASGRPVRPARPGGRRRGRDGPGCRGGRRRCGGSRQRCAGRVGRRRAGRSGRRGRAGRGRRTFAGPTRGWSGAPPPRELSYGSERTTARTAGSTPIVRVGSETTSQQA